MSLVYTPQTSFADAFTRPNATTLGPNWQAGPPVASGGALARNYIWSNEATPLNNTTNPPNNTSGTACSDVWAETFPSNNMYAQAVLSNLPSGTTQTNYGAYLEIRGNGNECVYAYVFLGNFGYGIGTTIAGTPTDRQTVSTGSVTAGSTVKFTGVGNVYTLYVGGSSVLSWTDSTNIYVPGPTRRQCGIETTCLFDGTTASYGPGWKSFICGTM